MRVIVLPTGTIVQAAYLVARAYAADTTPAPRTGEPFTPRPTIGECCSRCGCLCHPDETCPGCVEGVVNTRPAADVIQCVRCKAWQLDYPWPLASVYADDIEQAIVDHIADCPPIA
jgi:hypothetical protein